VKLKLKNVSLTTRSGSAGGAGGEATGSSKLFIPNPPF
jgi:hypothetical protein